MQRILLALSFLSAFSFSPVNAGSNGFFSNLAGHWSGSGQAYLLKNPFEPAFTGENENALDRKSVV